MVHTAVLRGKMGHTAVSAIKPRCYITNKCFL